MLDWLAHRAQVSPHKLALLCEGRAWRYADLQRETAQLCRQLAAAGLGAGQHVAVLMPNRAEYVLLIHALARLGAVLVPLNTRLTAAELRWQVEHSDCRALICDATTEALAGQLGLAQVLSVEPPATGGVEALARYSAAEASAWQQRPLNLEATQGIIFTSGTSGRPKGAQLSFGNHFYSATASAYRLGVLPDDCWLAAMPLYHVGGQAIVLRACLYGIAVALHRRFEPEAVGWSLANNGVTLISVVPTMLHRLLEVAPDSLSAPNLRGVLVGGAALPEPLLARCQSRGLPVATTYGLTEAASQVATTGFGQAYHKPGSVGKALLFGSVRVVDGAGNPLPGGEMGEIVVGGPTVMQGYYRQPEATAEALRGGELFTGDLGYLDDNGDLWVVQRRSDLIISGGENVYPAEVEQALRRHPAVAEVCVVGLPDEAWGQRVAAVVVLRSTATAAELISFGRTQLGGYKLPRHIEIVESLPQTASGKISREAVRQMLARGV